MGIIEFILIVIVGTAVLMGLLIAVANLTSPLSGRESLDMQMLEEEADKTVSTTTKQETI